MRDRISTKILDNGATRYGVYDEDGNLLRYEYIKLEDEPDEEGTILNKANLLTDETAAALGLESEDPTVNGAFVQLNQHLTDVEAGSAKIEVGSYVGTGTYGSANPNRLTFDFEPKCLLIANYGMLMFAACLIPASYGYYSMMYYNSGFAKGELQMKQNGTEITWYSNSGSPAATWSPKYQMNDRGVTYQYIAIGWKEV